MSIEINSIEMKNENDGKEEREIMRTYKFMSALMFLMFNIEIERLKLGRIDSGQAKFRPNGIQGKHTLWRMNIHSVTPLNDGTCST